MLVADYSTVEDANSGVTLTPHDGRWRKILNQLLVTKTTEKR